MLGLIFFFLQDVLLVACVNFKSHFFLILPLRYIRVFFEEQRHTNYSANVALKVKDISGMQCNVKENFPFCDLHLQ